MFMWTQRTWDRFWSRVVKGERKNDCWTWAGAHYSNGYAEGYDGKRPIRAHRAMWILHNGLVPEGLVIDHICNNRGCVNPSHLRAVTQQVNILRGTGMAARHAAKTHCPQGHPYSAENTYYESKGGKRLGRRCKTCNSEDCKKRFQERMAKRGPKPPLEPKPCPHCGKVLKHRGSHFYFIHPEFYEGPIRKKR